MGTDDAYYYISAYLRDDSENGRADVAFSVNLVKTPVTSVVKDGPSLPHPVRPFCLKFDHLEKTLQNMGRKGRHPNLPVVLLNFQHTNLFIFLNSERGYILTRGTGVTFYIINTTVGIIIVNET